MKSLVLRYAKTVRVVSITLAGLLLMSVVSQAQCSNKTLFGNYSFVVEGQILGVGPVNGVAQTHFDGTGNLTQVDFVVHAGVVPPGWRPGAGTYSVNSDCTGNAVITPVTGPALNLEFVVLKNGNEIKTVVANSGYQVNSIGVRGDGDEQDWSLIRHCNDALAFRGRIIHACCRNVGARWSVPLYNAAHDCQPCYGSGGSSGITLRRSGLP